MKKIFSLSALMLLFNSFVSLVWAFPLSIHVGKHFTDEGTTSGKLFVLGKETDFRDLNEEGQLLKSYDAFAWKDLSGIYFSASEKGVEIKEGRCGDSTINYINKKGNLLSSARIDFEFDFINSEKYKLICKMSGTYGGGTMSVPIYAELDEKTKPRKVTFELANDATTQALTSTPLLLKEDYKLTDLTTNIKISTKKTIGTAKGTCPALKNFQNGNKILASVTYTISYEKAALACTPTFRWKRILK